MAAVAEQTVIEAIARGWGDKDSSAVFRWQGNGLLRGDYPRSEYPVGAVLLFALEAWLGGGATRTANALLMAPFHLLVLASVWLARPRFGAWLAAVVALWPLNAFYWEFKFDLVPAALLVLGLLAVTWAGYHTIFTEEELLGIRELGGSCIFTMHPQIVGRPSRLAFLDSFMGFAKGLGDVWIAPCGEIAEWAR
jgi:hypothetical protein